MTTLQYSPEFDHIWIGCSYDEAEEYLLPVMEAAEILHYLDLKKRREANTWPDEDTIMETYDLGYLPDTFFVVSRDLKVCHAEEPFYPVSALVPAGVFEDCDHIYLRQPSMLGKLVLTQDGTPFNNNGNQFKKTRLYFDMDGTIVDFESGLSKVNENVKAHYQDHPEDIEGIFALMDPMHGAEDAVYELADYYDCYILSTAPWDNPGAWEDKVRWIQNHFGDIFYKKVILTHSKDLLNDGESILIDDRKAHGADAFGKNLILFGSDNRGWRGVAEDLIHRAQLEGVGISWSNTLED